MNRTMLFVGLLLVSAAGATAQTAKEIEFRNKPLPDVLLSLGELYGCSVVPDETVSGNVSCYLNEADIDRALEMILPSHHLYTWREKGMIRVSRIRIKLNEDRKRISVDADDVDAALLLRRLSEATGRSIMSGSLVGRKLTVHAKALRPDEVLALVSRRFTDLLVDTAPSGVVIRPVPPEGDPARREHARGDADPTVSLVEGRYNIQAATVRFRDAIRAFLKKAGKQVAFVGTADPRLSDLSLSDKTFDEMLNLLLSLGGAACSILDGTYIVYDVKESDRLTSLDITEVIPLAYLRADTLPSLLPPEVARSNHYRVDTSSNSVVINGKPAEVEPITRVLRSLDRPPANREYRRFDLSYLDARDFLSGLPKEFCPSESVLLPGARSFILPVSQEQGQRLIRYIREVDRAPESHAITLRYLRVADLTANPPPAIAAEEIRSTSDPSTFFFTGGPNRQEHLREQLAVMDRPSRQIRYELLVIQNRRGESRNSEVNLSNAELTTGDRNGFLGSIGKLLSLKFDIVSAFGYLFALDLSLDLSTARARVLADTTLNGISGEEITFRNTDTYRYRDAVVDPDTGRLDPTGVVREITSGLIIGINGWVSGDDVITMDITTTVSARGADTTGSANTLPTTSEKVITTHVRTSSGRPVVIGGLLERSSDVQVDRVPGVGDLPFIGRLFSKRTSSDQGSELSVYILPHVERVPSAPLATSARLRRIYDELVVEDVRG